MRALEKALATKRGELFLATQRDASVDEPGPNEIYQVGTVVKIVQNLRLPDGNIKLVVEGIQRGIILKISETEGFMKARVRLANYASEVTPDLQAEMQLATSLFEQYVNWCRCLDYDTATAVMHTEDPSNLADGIAGKFFHLSIEEKQSLLEMFDSGERLRRLAELLEIEIKKPSPERTVQSHRGMDEMRFLGIDPAHWDRLRKKINPSQLSRSELDLIRGVCEGLTNREIAERCGVSQQTVKNELFRLFDKLGVSSRVELLYLLLLWRSGDVWAPKLIER